MIGGSEKTYAQVKAEIEWSTGRDNFVLACKKLHHAGLIDKTRARRLGRQPVMLVSITPAGRQNWVELVDFYLYHIKRFGSRFAEIPKKTLPSGNAADRQFRPHSTSEEK